MSKLREKLLSVATNYAANRGRSLLRFLGDGNDGAVWESDQQTAIKALERRDSYLRERDAYRRLQYLGIVDIQGFAVPWLIDFDDTKQIVEMTVVFPPCILDFAKAYVDSPPDFSEDALAVSSASYRLLQCRHQRYIYQRVGSSMRENARKIFGNTIQGFCHVRVLAGTANTIWRKRHKTC